jgi:hypothetical protein
MGHYKKHVLPPHEILAGFHVFLDFPTTSMGYHNRNKWVVQLEIDQSTKVF